MSRPLCLFTLALCACHPGTSMPAPNPIDASPIACRLDALNPAQRTREAELLKELRRVVVETREEPDGYSFRCPNDPAAFSKVAELVSLEHRCCPFLNFSLEWPGGDAAPWLHVTGGARIKPFVESTFGGG